MSDAEPQFNKRPHGKVKFRPDCSQVLAEVHGTPGGALQGDEGRVQAGTARQDMGYMPLLGSIGGVFWGTWAKARLVSSNPKKLGFGKLCGRLLREVRRGKPWEVGENAYHQGGGVVQTGSYMHCGSLGCYVGPKPSRGAGVGLRPLSASWPPKMDVTVQYCRVVLLNSQQPCVTFNNLL